MERDLQIAVDPHRQILLPSLSVLEDRSVMKVAIIIWNVNYILETYAWFAIEGNVLSLDVTLTQTAKTRMMNVLLLLVEMFAIHVRTINVREIKSVE